MRSAVLQELERRVGDLSSRPPGRSPAPTGIAPLDRLLPGGGLPRGRSVEWLGPRSCGKTALLRAALARRLREGEPVALVDGGRTLWAPDWTGLETAGSLWVVRPPEPREAAWCADVLLRSGAFGAVALDTGETGSLAPRGDRAPSHAPAALRRGPAVRLQRLAEEAGAVWIVLGPLPVAALRLRFRPGRLEPLRAPPFGVLLPPFRPVWVELGEGRSAEVPLLCPHPPDRGPRPAARDRKGPR